jgi:hypothetical protein
MSYGKEEGPSQEYWERRRGQEIGMSVLKFLGNLADNTSGTFGEKQERCKESYDFWFNLVKSGKPVGEKE